MERPFPKGKRGDITNWKPIFLLKKANPFPSFIPPPKKEKKKTLVGAPKRAKNPHSTKNNSGGGDPLLPCSHLSLLCSDLDVPSMP